MTPVLSAIACRRGFMTASIAARAAARSSSSIVAIEPSAAAQATGLPP